jgi:hypothetical protein
MPLPQQRRAEEDPAKRRSRRLARTYRTRIGTIGNDGHERAVGADCARVKYTCSPR